MNINNINKLNNTLIHQDSILNNLADLLINEIKSKKDFFESTTIVVPKESMEQWFKAYWLRNEDTVLMNVNFISVDDALYIMKAGEKSSSIARRNELRTMIIKHLIMFDKDQLDKNLSSYIYDKDGNLDSIHLYDLANTLSTLFMKYEKENFDIVKILNQDNDLANSSQYLLYHNVINDLKNNNITTLSNLINNTSDNELSFKKYKNPIYFFGFSDFDNLSFEFIKQLEKNNQLVLYFLKQPDLNLDNKPNINLTGCPSKIKEIEVVHSKICSIVKNNLDVNFSDFLVLSPDISKYEAEIGRVFSQDNLNFPSIPYSINDFKVSESEVTIALKDLFNVTNKKFFTRYDFFKFVNNKVIQKTRDISLDDTVQWGNAIIDMNVFRNGKKEDDWAYAKKRLILSKVASMSDPDENIIETSCGKYVPFSSIELSDESIIKFIKVIDDINLWMNSFTSETIVTKEVIDNLRLQLEGWFSIKNKYGTESNKTLLKLERELDNWINFDLISQNIPFNTLMYTLFDLSNENKSKSSNLFVNGVTFTDYDSSTILSSKYLFFIGLSSKEFPIKELQSEIDLREDTSSKDDMDLYETQCLNNANGLYLSYVNINLKTDEDYFPSSYVSKLFAKYNLDIKSQIKISLDETRKWCELYTKKEYKDKTYYNGLFKTEKEQPPIIISDTDNINQYNTIKLSNYRDYLTEPLKYKYSKLFGKEDNIQEEIHQEYEATKIDSLVKYNYISSLIEYLINNPDKDFIDKTDTETDTVIDNKIDVDLARSFFERALLEHKIPNINEELTDECLIELVNIAVETKNFILNTANGNVEIIKNNDLIINHNSNDIVLTSDYSFAVASFDTTRKYFELCDCNGTNDYEHLLKIYLCALMDIASLTNMTEYTTEYNIEIYHDKKNYQSFVVTPSQAFEILENIYIHMVETPFDCYLPINKINKKRSFDDAKEEAIFTQSNCPWAYFEDRKMFNGENDLGFNKSNYDVVFESKRDELLSLVIYIENDLSD